MNSNHTNDDMDEHNDGDVDDNKDKNVSSLDKNLHLLFLFSN